MGGGSGTDLRVGTAGWSYDDWEGIVYPREMGRGFDQLAYLAQFFDCLEINSSFYRIPEPRVCAGWVRRVAVNNRFRFTVKLSREFTHDISTQAPADADAFRAAVEPIRDAGKLGCVLAQFPWSFRNTPEHRTYLTTLFREFCDLPIVLEVRHASWDEPRFYALLRESGVGFCNIDQPQHRDSMGPSARSTSAVGYVRLHGQNYNDWFREDAGRDERYNYLYSDVELEAWARRIEALRGRLPSIYIIMNNHFKGQAACNALQLRARLAGLPVRVPPPLLAAFPQLKRISAGHEGQAELFS